MSAQGAVFDTIIIGAGQAGVPLARDLAQAGQTVALVESTHLGGSCVNFGCTPSKALIASARAAADARRAHELGVQVGGVTVDFAAVMDRVRAVAGQSRGELEQDFAHSENPLWVRARAVLDGRDGDLFRVRAGGDVLRAARVVLNTGSRSALPTLEGLDSIEPITAENWVGLRTLPRRLAILGGGYIAVEMAQAFRRLGAEVVVLQAGPHLADHEDADVTQALQHCLAQDGVEIRLNADVQRVLRTEQGVQLKLQGGVVDATHLFVATGRKPNTDGLGLDSVGVALDAHGHVQTGPDLATNVAGIWAAGDIRGGPAFTPAAYDDHCILRDRFLHGEKSRDWRKRLIPYAMFTDPELGRVGMTETEARKAGKRVIVGRSTMRDNGRARGIGRTEGFVKLLVDADSKTFLGATALCEHGAELVQLFVELMNAGADLPTMLNAVHIHPTLAEVAKNAARNARDQDARTR